MFLPSIISVIEFLLFPFKKRNFDLNFGCIVQLGPKFMKENGLKHVTFSTADGALEAAPAVRDSVVVFEVVHKNSNYPAYN